MTLKQTQKQLVKAVRINQRFEHSVTYIPKLHSAVACRFLHCTLYAPTTLCSYAM